MKMYEMAEPTEIEERKWNCHQHVAKCSGSPHPHFPPSYLSSFHSCTDDLNGNDLHLRQWRSPNLISYLPLPSLSPLITHTHKTALWRFKPLSTSSLLSHLPAKLCPARPIVTVIHCVILYEPIVSLDLQTWQVRVAGKCVRPWQAFVRAWWYLSAFKNASCLQHVTVHTSLQ